jgi:hypothetical protein
MSVDPVGVHDLSRLIDHLETLTISIWTEEANKGSLLVKIGMRDDLRGLEK